MSILKLISSVAVVSVATTGIIVAQPAASRGNMTEYSVSCADGVSLTVFSEKIPDGMTVCGNRGYNGGVIKGSDRSTIKARPEIDRNLSAIGVNSGGGAVNNTEKARDNLGLVPEDRRDASDGKGNNIPVLNCSKSKNNPPKVDVSTGKPGWTLKLPNGAASGIVPTPNMVPSPWTAVPGAQWVGPQGAPNTAGVFTYETKVHVVQCPKGNPAKITAQFRADNIGTLTLIGPAPSYTVLTTMNQAGTVNYGFLAGSLSPNPNPGTFSWSGSNGIYTIRMTVKNNEGPTGVAANIIFSR